MSEGCSANAEQKDQCNGLHSATGLGALAFSSAARALFASVSAAANCRTSVHSHGSLPTLAERLRIGGGNEWCSGLQVDAALQSA